MRARQLQARDSAVLDVANYTHNMSEGVRQYNDDGAARKGVVGPSLRGESQCGEREEGAMKGASGGRMWCASEEIIKWRILFLDVLVFCLVCWSLVLRLLFTVLPSFP